MYINYFFSVVIAFFSRISLTSGASFRGKLLYNLPSSEILIASAKLFIIDMLYCVTLHNVTKIDKFVIRGDVVVEI